jgi:hypothetical protein
MLGPLFPAKTPMMMIVVNMITPRKVITACRLRVFDCLSWGIPIAAIGAQPAWVLPGDDAGLTTRAQDAPDSVDPTPFSMEAAATNVLGLVAVALSEAAGGAIGSVAGTVPPRRDGVAQP